MRRTVLWSIGFFLVSALDGQTTAAPPPVGYETATVVARPVDSTAVAVSVVDRSAIEASGAATVAEVLPFLPGVTLLSGGTRGGLTAVQLRGGDPNFTRVLIDGVPCNDGTTQVGEVFNLEGVPAVGVERIEVVRGPLSAVYGSTGLAGAINVVTRRGEGPLRGELSASAGQAHERGGAVWLGGGGARADGFLSGVRQEERERIAEERFDLSQLSGQGRWSVGAGASLRLAGRLAAWAGDDYPDASGGPVYGDGRRRKADNDESGLALDLSRETAAAFWKLGARSSGPASSPWRARRLWGAIPTSALRWRSAPTSELSIGSSGRAWLSAPGCS